METTLTTFPVDIQKLPSWRQLFAAATRRQSVTVDCLPAGQFVLLLSMLAYAIEQKKKCKLVWIVDQETQVEVICGRLLSWQQLCDLGQSVRRSIHKITRGFYQSLDALGESEQHIVVLSREIMGEHVPTRDELKSTSLLLKTQMQIGLNDIAGRIGAMGYTHVEIVSEPLQYTQRGGIIDVYPPQLDYPLRIELWGDEIVSIRYFDTQEQRSLRSIHNKIEQIHIPTLAGSDFSGSLAAYLGDCLLVEERSHSSSPDSNDVSKRLTFVYGQESDVLFDFEALACEHGRLRNVYRALAEQAKKHETWVVSNQAKRLEESFISAQERVMWKVDQPRAKVAQMEVVSFVQFAEDAYPIEGFSSEGLHLSLFTDFEIFGLVQAKSKSLGLLQRRYQTFLQELREGDVVVHSDHGIGVFAGTQEIEAAGVRREYIILNYADQDRLYVPVTQIDKVSKYIGKEEDQITLGKLGGKRWASARKKAESDAAQIARELLELYAKRTTLQGFAFQPDDELMHELEASFPYLETPDQLRAIYETKQDMESTKPMDRLVCGDVGFGKTEVAVRAALKAVSSGKQVALLAPTTILAKQHYDTFCERLDQFGVRVAMLSRFQTADVNAGHLEKLAVGRLDVIVGTHRLLSEDVGFHDLGLLVVDEEQRFGVQHKERIKKMRAAVDILALSATPIPRSLHLALVGMRDMSIIASPPKGRLPVETTVAVYNDAVIAQAIEEELARQGRVFVIYNRVKSIDRFAEHIASLVPRARIVVGHGQMESDEMEEKLYSFIEGSIDVLVASTIVEHGMDIRGANTMIVVGAEDFGLASLYQLRGRVGRGSTQAYCYFLYQEDRLTPKAAARLQAIREVDELGAGLTVALRDLEIRGAGNILGVEQSGHIEGVGFELYSKLFKRAVERQRTIIDGVGERSGERGLELEECTVDLPLSAFIPDNYIQSFSEKMRIYQTMGEINDEDKIMELALQLNDRFGTLPTEVLNLLYILKLRILAARRGIKSISVKTGIVYFEFQHEPHPTVAMSLLRVHHKWQVKGSKAQIHFKYLGENWQEMVERSLEAIKS
jgi:transcription-repair coupling factor (superfamily II helicase)